MAVMAVVLVAPPPSAYRHDAVEADVCLRGVVHTVGDGHQGERGEGAASVAAACRGHTWQEKRGRSQSHETKQYHPSPFRAVCLGFFFATFPLVSLPGHLLQRLLGVWGSVQWELRRSPSTSLKKMLRGVEITLHFY